MRGDSVASLSLSLSPYPASSFWFLTHCRGSQVRSKQQRQALQQEKQTKPSHRHTGHNRQPSFDLCHETSSLSQTQQKKKKCWQRCWQKRKKNFSSESIEELYKPLCPN